jgi:DNA-binding transcriptional ArsR family regulator
MSEADALRAIAAVVEILQALDGVDIKDTRRVRPTLDGERARATVVIETPIDSDAVDAGTADDETADAEPTDEVEPAEDSDDQAENPYILDGFGDQDTVEVDATMRGSPRIKLPPLVREHIADQGHDRLHVRERDGGVYLVAGGSDEWPDYSAEGNSASMENSRVSDQILDVVPGDEVHFEPAGDDVLVEPKRIVEREDDDSVELDVSLGQFSPAAADILEALAADQPQTRSELEEVTGRADSTVSGGLSTLKDEGLVESEPDPDDSRRYIYRLTDAAIAGSTEREQWEAIVDA